MTNRRRHHALCLRLTDAEYDLWTAKQKASGLSMTDYLMQAIRNSEVRICSVEESIAPIVHEIRKIGIAGSEIRISHCQNEKSALFLKEQLESQFPGVSVVLMETRGLDSFYAERHGLIVGF